MKRSTTLAAVAAAGIFTTGAVGAIAASSSDTLVPSVPDAPRVSAVQETTKEAFRVFRRDVAPEDEMPPAVVDQVARSYGNNSKLARAIVTPTGKGWVLPGHGRVCVVAPDPVDGYGVACSTPESAAAFGIGLALSDKQGSSVVVLVPDNGQVAVREGNGPAKNLTPDSSGIVAFTTETPTIATTSSRNESREFAVGPIDPGDRSLQGSATE